MRKALAILFAVSVCCALLSGCGDKAAEDELAVYSFCGENEYQLQLALTEVT